MHKINATSILVVIFLVTANSGRSFAEEPLQPPKSKRLNVLFLVSDDLRPELGCYGNKIIKSPSIDRLAKNGIVFNRAYCQQAVCSPSRTSVMTGVRPDTAKVWDLNTHFRKNIPDVVTLPQLFIQNGYQAMGLGKIYHGNLKDPDSWSATGKKGSANRGNALQNKSKTRRSKNQKNAAQKKKDRPRGPAFRISDDGPNEGGEGKLADEAIDALKKLKAESKPFFLAVGFHKPHLPFIAPKCYWDMYESGEIPMASNRFLPHDAPSFSMVDRNEMWKYKDVPDVSHFTEEYARKLKHGYYAAVSYMDAQLGRILDEVDRLELANDTIIVLWGDHGWKLGEHDRWCKHSNVEDDTRAPLIISVPGMKNTNRKTNALVEFVDIYPSLVDLAGLKSPSHLEGKSFRSVLENPNRPWKTAAFSQYPRTVKGKRLMGYSMRTDRYRFTNWVHRYDHSKSVATELYDHQTDPQENFNIANNSENKELVATLLKQWQAGWKGAEPN